MALRGRRLALAALGVAAGGLLGAGWTVRSAEAARARAERRLAGRSRVVPTRFGAVEFAVAGDGPPLLMIHGTGGGFDQGLRFSQALLRRGHQAIAPSRFGYLRSDFPADPSSERQADAFADLLDHLGIERLPVAGGSAGALSAAQFALRHPQRCRSLVLLVPAANLHGQDPVEFDALQRLVVERVLASDTLFWLASNTMRPTLIRTLLATDPALLDRVSPAERERALAVLEELMPISARVRGLLNDARLAGSPAALDLRSITVPTLVLSAEDDRFGTARTARDIASAVPGAKLVVFPRGGHLLLGHDDDVADAISAFVGRPGES